MPHTDALMDRVRLKRALRMWKLMTLGVAVILAATFFSDKKLSGQSHIARYDVSGIVDDNIDRSELFSRLAEDASIPAVIVTIDSPGGTAVGGQALYRDIKGLSQVKPVVVSMRNMAASAAYMGALGASHIFAFEGTITASVGVIFQSAEVSKLADELGITPIIVKSGSLKAEPSMFTPVTDDKLVALDAVIQDFYAYFVTLVQTERKLDDAAVARIADGRVMTGRQALELGLLDGLGDIPEAKAWIATKVEGAEDLPVVQVFEKSKSDLLLSKLSGLIGRGLDSYHRIASGLYAVSR